MLVVTTIYIVICSSAAAQHKVDTTIEAALRKPEEFGRAVELRLTKVQQDFELKLNKKKSKLIREEQRIYNLISRYDSSFGTFENKLITNVVPQSSRSYIPLLDSLGTSLGLMKTVGLADNEQLDGGFSATSYVSNIPNMTKDQIGHDLGYGMGKTAEVLAISKGAGIVTKALQGAKSEAVFRVFGGDAEARGFSWTPKNPNSIVNYRDAAGLPSGGASGSNNTGRFVVEGTVKKKNIIKVKSADPLDGNKGGLTEYIIDPKNVKIKSVSGVNPKF
jgi:hypothetical protein